MLMIIFFLNILISLFINVQLLNTVVVFKIERIYIILNPIHTRARE